MISLIQWIKQQTVTCDVFSSYEQDIKAKRSPFLVPYSLLEERSRKLGRENVRDAVCTLLVYGYSLEPLSPEWSTSQSHLFIDTRRTIIISLPVDK